MDSETRRVATVGRDGSRLADCGNGIWRPIWTGAIYEARARQSDGAVTWRRVGSFGGTRAASRPSTAFLAHLQSEADRLGLEWEYGIRHGRAVKQ